MGLELLADMALSLEKVVSKS